MKEDKLKYIGQTFGNLVINEIIPFYKKNEKYSNQINYKCKIKCNFCNKEKIVLLYGVINGKTKSCGCQHYIPPKGLKNKKCKNLTNQRFNHLLAIEIDKSKTSRVFWKCKCDCGNFTSIATKHLTGNIAKSCGCHQFQKGKFSNSWKGYEEISGKQWGRAKKGALERNFEFSITIEDAWKKFIEQNRRCALSGVELKFGYSSHDLMDGNASLDRIDSSKGYTLDNIQWVDKKVNLIKMNIDEKEFIGWCKLISTYRA